MWGLTCAFSAYPAHPVRTSIPTTSTVRYASRLSIPVNPFVPEVIEAVDSLHSEFRAVDNLVAYNTNRVLKAFHNVRLGSHLGDVKLSIRLLQKLLGQNQLLFVHSYQLLAVAGAPYDTLEEVIGKRDSGGLGSLQDFGIKYREVPLDENGGLDWNALMHAVKPETKCALIQRSCGYSWRQSLSVNDIGRAIKIIKMQNPECSVMVDNCYGELVESIEPPMVGADLMAGSLIKNPGGTIAPCGGYVAGKKKLVEAAAARLSAPGLGVDCGSTPGDIMRAFFQGLYLSPQMVGEAIKAVQLGSRERLLAFCEAVQRRSPVGSYTKPIAGTTPGYASEVIFADGTFIDGSTSELSCDGPLREPFAVFCQGGTHWTQWGLVLGEVLKSIDGI
ncbi:hypothetical protein TSUD_69930 [Trifolium subterraneum]|uniref:Aminotransferase class V domain-containing protein n=2 Tax=Trifolium TaxID=3898 RepID=A0A2Z6NFG7_TRISU|nr:hypothetical protein TSUD_69930 [Trifolium subterraneum]